MTSLQEQAIRPLQMMEAFGRNEIAKLNDKLLEKKLAHVDMEELDNLEKNRQLLEKACNDLKILIESQQNNFTSLSQIWDELQIKIDKAFTYLAGSIYLVEGELFPDILATYEDAVDEGKSHQECLDILIENSHLRIWHDKYVLHHPEVEEKEAELRQYIREQNQLLDKVFANFDTNDTKDVFAVMKTLIPANEVLEIKYFLQQIEHE